MASHIQKFHDMRMYQFEIGYDLAISLGCNMSESPGFESVVGESTMVNSRLHES